MSKQTTYGLEESCLVLKTWAMLLKMFAVKMEGCRTVGVEDSHLDGSLFFVLLIVMVFTGRVG